MRDLKTDYIVVEEQRPLCFTQKAKEPPHDGEFLVGVALILFGLILIIKFGNPPKNWKGN